LVFGSTETVFANRAPPYSARVLVAEHILPDGGRSLTHLEEAPGGVRLRVDQDGTDALLPGAAVEAVMQRYGKPLDPAHDEAGGEAITLGVGKSLERMRFRAAVDVEARDYLVLRGTGEPLAALATGVAAALRFLARRRAVID